MESAVMQAPFAFLFVDADLFDTALEGVAVAYGFVFYATAVVVDGVGRIPKELGYS